MKAICDGQSTRQQVVQQNLDQYRAVFNRTGQNMDVLKAVSQITPPCLCSRIAYVGVLGDQEVRARRSESRLSAFARSPRMTLGKRACQRLG
jgi:hypothetical protein